MEYRAGKENLLADASLRKDKYFLDSTEEQDFIPHSIKPKEDHPEL